jgi:predicted O-linked N-acetylglucosamine transferase (SPINDLY family)
MQTKHSILNNKLAQGIQLLSYEQVNESIPLFKTVLQTDPKNPDALHFLGVAKMKKKQFNQALSLVNQAILEKSDQATYHNTKGLIYVRLNQLGKAFHSFLEAIRFKPDDPVLHCHLGDIVLKQNRLLEAIKHYDYALELSPDNKEIVKKLSFAHHQAGIAFLSGRHFESAAYHFKSRLQYIPNDSCSLNNLGLAYAEMGEIKQAIDCFRKASSNDSHQLKLIHNLLLFSNNLPECSRKQIFHVHQEWGDKYTEYSQPVYNSHDISNPKLHIGYVSPDYRIHPVSFCIQSILMHHDNNQFEIYCYADNEKNDFVTDQLKQYPQHWKKIFGKSDKDVVNQIINDRINILVDLAGHTSNNRLTMFAHKPAPVLCTYIGYQSTTGLKQMDYRITDDIIDPYPQADNYYTEQLLRLPYGLCYHPPDIDIPPNETPAINQKHITFGCFTNFYRMDHNSFSAWIKLLQLLPESRMILLSKPFCVKSFRQKIMDRFNSKGILNDRITLLPFIPFEDYLKLHHQIDIYLDTMIENGGTTLCHALWMGVPVVSLAGDSYGQRYGASILKAAGFADWIAKDVDNYIDIARMLSKDYAFLNRIRKILRNILLSSDLCNGIKFTRLLEDAYKRVWKKWTDNPKNQKT